jgi:hypothetical protein
MKIVLNLMLLSEKLSDAPSVNVVSQDEAMTRQLSRESVSSYRDRYRIARFRFDLCARVSWD